MEEPMHFTQAWDVHTCTPVLSLPCLEPHAARLAQQSPADAWTCAEVLPSVGQCSAPLPPPNSLRGSAPSHLALHTHHLLSGPLSLCWAGVGAPRLLLPPCPQGWRTRASLLERQPS